jgi:hypothetical protein
MVRNLIDQPVTGGRDDRYARPQRDMGKLADSIGLFLAFTTVARHWMPPPGTAEELAQVSPIPYNAQQSFFA